MTDKGDKGQKQTRQFLAKEQIQQNKTVNINTASIKNNYRVENEKQQVNKNDFLYKRNLSQ